METNLCVIVGVTLPLPSVQDLLLKVMIVNYPWAAASFMNEVPPLTHPLDRADVVAIPRRVVEGQLSLILLDFQIVFVIVFLEFFISHHIHPKIPSLFYLVGLFEQEYCTLKLFLQFLA